MLGQTERHTWRRGALCRMRRVGLLTVLFLLLSVTIGVVAATACNPGRTVSPNYHFWSGWDTGPTFDSGHCIDGSLADIQVKNPYVQALTTVSWTALINPISGEIGQDGWENKLPNYTRDNFAEFATTSTIHDLKEWPADPVGSYPEYKVTYSSGYFHLFENGATKYNFSDSSYAGCWAQQAGETHNWNSQMPGVPSDHEEFNNAEVRYSSDENWHTTSSWSNLGDVEGLCPSPFNFTSAPNAVCSGLSGSYDLDKGVHLNYSTSGSPPVLFIWDMCT
jgi:hypothetical protein